MHYTPELWVFILASVIITWLLVYTWQFRSTPTGRAFLALMLSALVWVVGFAFETAAVSLDAKLLFAKLQFLAIPFIPVIWVYLVLAFTSQAEPDARWRLLFLIPISTNLVIWTNAWHGWFYGAPHLEQINATFAVLHADYQFWFYYLHAPAGYLCVVLALVILLRALPRLPGLYRRQGYLLLSAILLPSLVDLLYVLGFSPIPNYNLTTAVFSLSGVIIAWALFRYQFLDLLPLARDLVIENLTDGVIVMDPHNRIVDLNPAARRMAQISAAAIGRPLSAIESEFIHRIEILSRDQRQQADLEIDAAQRLYYDVRLTPVLDRRGQLLGRVISIRDITERVQLFRQVQELAVHDGLTGIFNRRRFLELSEREFQHTLRDRSHTLGMLIFDLDHFKTVNDRFGHAAGDLALTRCTETVQPLLRTTDIFGRLGGEEFAVLLVDADPAKLNLVAERIRLAIEALRIPWDGNEITLTASLGAVSSEDCGESVCNIEAMLHLADQALYRAKDLGRNCTSIWKPHT